MADDIPAALRRAVTFDAHGMSFDTTGINPYRGPLMVLAPLFAVILGVVLWGGLVSLTNDLVLLPRALSDQLAVPLLFVVLPLPTLLWNLFGRITGSRAAQLEVRVDGTGLTVTEPGGDVVRHPRHRIAHCYAPPDTKAIALHLTEPEETVYLTLDCGFESRQWLANQIAQNTAAARDVGELAARETVEEQSKALRQSVKREAQ